MSIKYPERLICPICKTDIRFLDTDSNKIETNDLMMIGLHIPISYNFSDFAKNNQNLGRRHIMVCVCVQCGAILSSDLYGY
ncbi:MAG: hypothetical protein EAX96_08895 [Candidatus Lokiarchaeota archaeon]|nr:hypothetical protein [Candidatus Lokiarchaeota archaeon]